MTVLDFGAGRGEGPLDDGVPYRRALRILRGKCAHVIGVDVAQAVLDNPFVDEAFVVAPGEPLPIADQSVDLIVSDAVFEHIAQPDLVASELVRVLRPSGWICARTPNRWGYIGIGTNLVPNRWHVAWLRRLQPRRKDIDVFPTVYRLNTRGALARFFPRSQFLDCTYGYFGEPAYFGNSKLLWRVVLLMFRFSPEALAGTWFVFLQKRKTAGAAGS
jgi:SAM-dependent methyltransferase